jgi:tetratricopeptide (TPR) repeat protein
LPYFYRGIVYDTLEELELAIADYTKAIELDPDFVDGYLNRAYAYFRSDRQDEAVADWLMAYELTDNQQVRDFILTTFKQNNIPTPTPKP